MKSKIEYKPLKKAELDYWILIVYTMKIKIHELVSKEFDQAIEWYDQKSEGLENRFKKTIKRCTKKVKKNPEWYLKESDDIYKAYIPKFPYKLLFTVEKNEIIIWAIAHMHRKPWY